MFAVFFGSLFVFAAALPYAAAQDEGVDEELEIEEVFEGGPGMMERPQHRMKGKVRKDMRPGMGEGGGEEKGLALIRQHDPVFHDKLLELRESAPVRYKVAMRMAGRMLMMAKMQQDPVLEKNVVRTLALEHETRELGLAYEKAGDSGKAKLRADLKKGLSELFDLRLGNQEVRVKHMEKDLARLKAQIEKRKASKARLVEGRLEQMTGEAETW